MSSELQDFLHDENLDGFLVLTQINRQYLSGFTGSSGMLLITKKRMQLFVDGRYTLRAKKESTAVVKDIDKLALELKRQKIKKLAIEDKITLAQFGWLKVNLKGVKWEITKDIIENIRAEKSKAELRYITRGSRIIDQVFKHIVSLLEQKKDLRELDLALEIEKTGKKLGAEEMAFDPIVAFGANAASPHHNSCKQKIERNNFLLLDFGMKVSGYHSDFTRTLFLGRPSSYQAKVYETVLKAQLNALGTVAVDQKASMVDAAARQIISKAGFGKYFTHNTGHGVGLEIHELPNFSEKSEEILKPNMVVTVEPGIYLPEQFGIRIEDMVLIQSKPKIFSKIPKDFQSMIIN